MKETLQEEIILNAPTDDQLKNLNWPALVFPWIWCFFHRLYLLGCIAIIPIVTIFIGIYLLFNGNRLDWERNKNRGAELYLKRRKRWNRVTAIIFICLLTIGGFAAVYEALTGGFSWKQYPFENGKLSVLLPFELRNTAPNTIGERIAYAQSYQAGNDRLNVTLSYTESKAEYEFVLEEMFGYSLESLKSAKDIKVFRHKYEELKYNNYSAGKMTVEYVSDGIKCTSEYVYILVANNRCWYLCNTYQSENTKSREASERIFNSINLK